MKIIFRLFALVACVVSTTQAIPGSSSLAHAEKSTVNKVRQTDLIFLSDAKNGKYTRYDDSKGVILFEASINGKSTWGVLDTAADVSLVDKALFASTGGELASTDVKAFNFDTQFDLARANDVGFEFKDQFKLTADFFAADLNALSARLDKPIGVLLGSNLLQKIAFLINSKSKRILFINPNGVKVNSSDAVMLVLDGQSFSGRINGTEARMRFDTASNVPFSVYETSWDKYFDGSETVPVGRGFRITGDETRTYGTKKAQVEFGGITGTSVVQRAEGDESRVDANIGYPVLQSGTFVFNYPRGTITIVPHSQ